ncbi:unnamed protein product [Sphagnum balticum]
MNGEQPTRSTLTSMHQRFGERLRWRRPLRLCRLQRAGCSLRCQLSSPASKPTLSQLHSLPGPVSRSWKGHPHPLQS